MDEYEIRHQALALATEALDGEDANPFLLWSVARFYEQFLLHGSEGTKEEFSFPDEGSDEDEAVPASGNVLPLRAKKPRGEK